MSNELNQALITIHADQAKPISTDLFGIFFEDINYAADGGLYAELIQNRSFEYQATEVSSWNSLTAWERVMRDGGECHLNIDAAFPIHPNNPHYAVLEVTRVGDGSGIGIRNTGFDGIPVVAGESYIVSLFARHLYTGGRWTPADPNAPMPRLTARLESVDGALLGEAILPKPNTEWTRLEATITATQSDNDARFVLLMSDRGGVALDVISLFPQKTFQNRRNGLRADLAQTIADLKPRFIRFPGGCLVHGNGLGNMYRWKDTIGPIEQRKEQANLWRYHQTVGLGYFEYFQFCEDIGAKPVPVVPAGVCCQNSGYVGGIGQKGLPLEEMPDFIQDVLDLIEWANGPVTSLWGAKRAEAGHPEPFGLEYLGVGNEDHITPTFRERFTMIYEAVKAAHPEITVIGTVGPFHSGEDYDEGWKIARELSLEMVDEHYYEKPDWFWENTGRYDSYDRGQAAVYLGEFAAHENDRSSTLRSALAEAAAMTGLERNGDVVRLASYAPLLAKQGHTQWRPDLIYFDNTTVSPTINYSVQQLFATNSGDVALILSIETDAEIAASCVQETQSGDVIVKIVSRADVPIPAQIDLRSLGVIKATATCTVLAGDPMAENRFSEAPTLLPQTADIMIGEQFIYEIPAHSFSVIRIKRL